MTWRKSVISAALAVLLGGEPLPADQAVENAVRESYATNDPERLAELAETLEQAVAAAPADLHLREALGLLYLDKLKLGAKARPHLAKIVQVRPGEAGWTQALARAARAAGDLEEAARLFARNAELQPGDPWPRHEQAAVLLQLGRHAEGETVLREALQAPAAPAYLRLALAQELLATDRAPEVRPLLEEYLREKPEDAAARAQLAALPAPVSASAEAVAAAYQSGDHAQFEKAASLLEDEVRGRPEDLAARKTLAFTWLEKLHLPAKALPHLAHIVEKTPEDPVWLGLLARAERELGHHEEAAAWLKKSAELQPGEPWVRYEYGQALAALHRHREAEAAYQAALALQPDSAWLHVALGWELLAEGRATEAAAAVRDVREDAAARALLQACHAVKKPLTPLQQAVATAYQTGDRARFAAAAALLEAQLRAHPDDLANRKTLAFTYLDKLRDPRSALPHLQRVTAALPRDAGWAGLLAKACDQAHDAQGSAEAWRRAAELAPRDAWARYHLGQALTQLACPREAEAAFQAALALDPQNAFVQVELGRLSLTDGRRGTALRFAHAALAHDPANSDAHVLLGDLYRGDFQFRAARREYGTVLQVHPEYTAAQQGVEAMTKDERAQAKLVFFTFTDTDHLQQSGLFGYFTPFIAGPFKLSPWANELFFKEPPGETIERFETGLDAQWRLSHWVQLSAGLSRFKTSNLPERYGWSAGLYLSPARQWDAFVTWRSGIGINDSYLTAQHAFYQDVLAAGLTVRPVRGVTAVVTASTSDYFVGHADAFSRYQRFVDRNERRYALASLGWDLYPRAGAALRLEYLYQDFNHHTRDYSSPQNYQIVRPVLELAPSLTSWLKLEFRGELPFVLDERAWGTGLSAGPKINFRDRFELSFRYLDYRLPDYQTNYSGHGFKIELSGQF